MFPELPPDQAEALEQHQALLLKWNRVINLTTEQSWERHYGESLFLAQHLPAGELRIADIGSGAGFPGFPVAVVRPDCRVTLVESHRRKAVFLREASRKLANIRVLDQRVEDVVKAGEQFDWVISRGVSYDDLGPSLQRLGPNALLLTGAEEPPAALNFCWEAPIQLAASRARYLRSGVRCFT